MLNTGQLTGLLTLLIIVLSGNISAADGHEIKKIDEILEMLNAQATEIANRKEKLAEMENQEATVLSTNVPQDPDAVGAAGSRWSPMAEKRRARASEWAERTSIGGYGELHYNNLNGEDGASDANKTDFHRLVLFVGHEFNDWSRFASEIEFEHSWAGDGREGDVVVELAWLELDITVNHHFRAGADILPIGIMNLTHEPNTFYGVERNMVETEVIPTTWTEAGVGLWGTLAPGLNYNVFAHTGLIVPTSGSNAMRVRSGRKKVANAQDQDIAILGRLSYTGVPGLEASVTFDYQADYTGTADSIEADAVMTEAHLDYKHSSGLALRALYARWDFGKDTSVSFDPSKVGADTIEGWYVEPSYKFDMPTKLPGELGIFVRYHEWDQHDGKSSYNLLTNEGAAKMFRKRDMLSIGANYWPSPNVVFKIDGQFEHSDGRPSSGTHDGLNLGMGFQF
jgi:hypothetical protein